MCACGYRGGCFYSCQPNNTPWDTFPEEQAEQEQGDSTQNNEQYNEEIVSDDKSNINNDNNNNSDDNQAVFVDVNTNNTRKRHTKNRY